MNVTCSVGTFFPIEYTYDYWKDSLKSIKIRQGVLNTRDTYWLIFNKDFPSNKIAYEYLLTIPGIKIIYQSKPAVNGNSGHGGAVRNFLLVFEYEEPVQPLSEVQS